MAYIDNSDSIIVDCVLTDEGRARLAAQNGTFKIAKFALVDTEIDYSLYNSSHPNGSAYFDLTLLTTPIFEAFSNNTSFLGSKLISIARSDILYLPVVKNSPNLGPGGSTYSSAGYYVVTCNQETISSLGVGQGIIDGQTIQTAQRTPIVCEQGLDTQEIDPRVQLDSDLKETQYVIRIDSRLGEIVSPAGTPRSAKISFIDSDKQALYFFSYGADTDFVSDITNTEGNSAIAGPRGTMFKFGVKSSINLNSNTYLFTTLGSTTTINGTSYYYIDTNIKVEGQLTGYTLDVPVRFLKKV
jgi:hypothetical protein